MTSERQRREERTSQWFDTFQTTTDQKENEKTVQRTLAAGLFQQKLIAPRVIADVGCGTGQVTAAVAGAVSAVDSLHVYCIDMDEEFTSAAKTALEALGENVTATAIAGEDAFAPAFGANLPGSGGIDLMIFNHIVYYAGNRTAAYIEDMAKRLSPNGAMIFDHESPDSDMNALRDRYGAPTDTKTTESIKRAVASTGKTLLERTMTSKLPFPEDWKEAFDGMRQDGLPEYDADDALRNLLEFVVQRPLEDMSGEGKLNGYLNEVQTLLENQEGRLHVRTRLQLVLGEEPAANRKRTEKILNDVRLPSGEKLSAVETETSEQHTTFRRRVTITREAKENIAEGFYRV
jgi:SAM-dependent methyltransferase